MHNNLLLIPALVNRAKDAARAVKAGVHTAITTITGSLLTHLLGLPHFSVIGYSIEPAKAQAILHLFCDLTLAVGICPQCQTISSTIKESKDRCVRDLDVWGKRTFIHFQIRRFECPHCQLRFTEELHSVGWRRRQTYRFEQAVYQACLQSSKKAVAEKYHLSQSTVYTIFKKWAKRQHVKLAWECVRVLGMDEIALKKRHKQYALILSDIERRCILAVLPSREQKVIAAWLKTLSLAQIKSIRTVSMDMWRPYRALIEKQLPQAQIVADRFHVMKQLNDQLSKARRQIQREASPEIQQALKGSRWLLVRNRATLTQEQHAQLHLALSAQHQLRAAYLLKEEFKLIFDRIHDKKKATRFLRAWIFKVQQTNNKYLLAFTKTLQNWWHEILNYFDERITNGFVEGLNRAIRTTIWKAYGFRNFDNFRIQILAEHGPP